MLNVAVQVVVGLVADSSDPLPNKAKVTPPLESDNIMPYLYWEAPHVSI